jgi:repressor LexA
MTFGETLRKKRQELGLTLDEVSALVNFSKPYLSTIETGSVANPPSDELLRKLEKVLKFGPGELLEMAHVTRMEPDVLASYESAKAENRKWRQLFKKMSEDKAGKELLGRLAKHGEFSEPNVESDIIFSPGRPVPIINKVTAGYPTDFSDLDYPVGIADDYVRCPDVQDPNAFAVRVVGDSMEPKYHEGDIVVFSPAMDPVSGDDCFVRFTSPHETTFKRVYFEDKTIRLQPRNEKYPPIIADDKKINGIYKAIAKVERL